MHAPLQGKPAHSAPAPAGSALKRGGAAAGPLQALLDAAPVVTRLGTQSRLLNGGAPAQLMSFFHGTELKTAQKLAGGTRITAAGTGEFGAGIYLTHILDHAAHIADYYTAKEQRGEEWGVVSFDVHDEALSKLSRKHIAPDEFKDYYESVKKFQGQDVESPFDWTVGPIKDRQTRYVQHLFARGGIALLNDDKVTERALAESGRINTIDPDYDYAYNQDETYLGLTDQNLGESSSSDEDSEDGPLSPEAVAEIETRLKKAADVVKLRRNATAELEGLEATNPEDYERLKVLKTW